MKKKFILQGSAYFLLFFLFTASSLFADAPPDPGGDPGGVGTPVGGGSPIGGGLVLFAIMSLFYGLKRILKYNQNEK